MTEETKRYIEEFHMVEPGELVLTALSGGADSVGLLMVLYELKEELGFDLAALHVHHGIRGEEADRDAAYAESLCRERGIAFVRVNVDVPGLAAERGLSLEEAGRLARYEALSEKAAALEEEKGCRVRIAVAHHSDDSAETFLHNLFRGSGLAGLSGIRPVRDNIIRPLLWTGHETICAYLRERGIAWMEDSTNEESEYTRNHIRNILLPQVKAHVNAKASENILRAAGFIAEAEIYFEEEARKWFETQTGEMTPVTEAESHFAEMPCQDFLAEAGILQAYLVREFLKRGGCPLKDITAVHIEAVKALAFKGTGHRVDLPHGYAVCNSYGVLKIVSDAEKRGTEAAAADLEDVSFEVTVKTGGNPMDYPTEPFRKWFDGDKINTDRLVLRRRRQGDYLTLAGGGRKSVKSFMIDNKIPRELRDRIPVLAEDDHVVWLVGYRISDCVKVSENTEHILEIKIYGGTFYV